MLQPKICFVELDDERTLKAMKKVRRFAEVVGVGRTEQSPLKKIRYYSHNEPLTKGLELLRDGLVDGLIAGAVSSSKELISQALRIVGTENDFASSFQILTHKNKKYYFADCGFNIDPSAAQLALIAEQTVSSVKLLGDDARVAFLSYSTNGSAGGSSVAKVQEATRIFKERNPLIIAEGEVQVDAALRPEVARRKNPKTILEGRANVLIFPDLDAGNIGYKLLKEIAGFEGIGPFLQGFKKPLHDLSRGCSSKEIVDSARILVKRIPAKKNA